MTHRRRPLRLAAIAGAALLLAGCAGFQTFTAVTTPSDLYALTPKSTFPGDVPPVRDQLVVETPTATAAVDSDRIAVQPNPWRFQYYPASRWVDRAPLMVQTLLVESFETSGLIEAVGVSAVGLRADWTLVTDLREFQARVPEGGGPDDPVEIVVRLNVKLIAEPDGRIVASRSFPPAEADGGDATVRAVSNDMLDVVRAFDEALGEAMKGAVVWTVREMAANRSRRSRF